MARGEFDMGAAAGETVLSDMMLELKPSSAQQAELDALVDAQHDPASPLYHQWLTVAQYGARFGVSAADAAQITAWLRGHGFAIEEVAPSGRIVIFSGNAQQVAEAFHTEIHRYEAAGVEHIANSQDPQIPAALAGVVSGVVSLHDFRRASEMSSKKALGLEPSARNTNPETERQDAQPAYTSGSTHYLLPADWAAIYDVKSLYTAGKTGTGASIAIVGRSNINSADVAAFRALSGLPANQPTVILVSSNPGLVSGDQDESTLDVEWSGAVAPAAALKFVVGASTATTDGVDLSAQYIVNHSTATVMSTSYGSCEQDMGTTELSFYNSLWQQAASEGISAFVSSGDSGAAGCSAGSAATGTMPAVNGLCTSPYATCVGGTEFNEGTSSAQYWAATNGANDESALSYIPEKVWNESALDGGSGLWASSGGTSAVYAQPSWQKGVGIASAMRTVPDVAATAAGHDGYIIEENGSEWVIAGTSAASPSFAGIMALVVQAQSGKGQGNVDPALYALLNASHNPFHATPSGNNSVPGVSGFTASGGAYNLATGLGSVDGALLVNGWGSGSTTITGVNFALTQSATLGSATAGKTISFSVGAVESGSAQNGVALAVKTPSGVTASVSPASIAPGSAATVTLTIAATAPVGTANITVTGSNSSGSQTVTYALTVTAPPTLTLALGAASVSVVQGSTGKLSLTAATGGSFSGSVSWSLSGLPAGVAGTWASTSAAAGSSAETLTLTASGSTNVGSSTITLTAAGDGLTASRICTVQVTQAPGITLAPTVATASMQSFAAIAVKVTATAVGGLVLPSNAAGSSIEIASGLPKGVTATWSAAAATGTSAISWTLTLTGSASAVASSSTLSLAAQVKATSGAAYAAVASLPLTVTLTPPALSLTAASSSLALAQGKTATQLVTVAANGTYSGPVTLSVSGLPSGVSASWSNSPVTLAAETGSSVLTFKASSTAVLGTVTLTVTAKGDGLTVTKPITLMVTKIPSAQLADLWLSAWRARNGSGSGLPRSAQP